MEQIINQACKAKNINNINQVKKKLIIPSVDLHNGKVYIFQSIPKQRNKRNTLSDKMEYIDNINIGKAVRASCSYPGVFCPMQYKNTELIDGGIRENVPWKELKQMGVDKVISVVFENEINENKCCPNIIEVVANSIEILSHELSNYELSGADYLIKIKTKKISLLDMSKIDKLYQLGYEIGKKEIEKIKRIMA